MQYKLLLSDFDGTIFSKEQGVRQEDVQAIQKYVANGGKFAFCTGRMFSGILPFAKAMGLKGVIAASQGAVIADIETGKRLVDERIEHNLAIEVARFFQSFGPDSHIHVYDGEELYINQDNEQRKNYEAGCQISSILTEFDIAKLVEEKKISPNKINIFCNPQQKDIILQQTQEKFSQTCYVTTSSSNWVEVSPKNIDKGTALQFIANYYNVPIEQTVTVGDNENDIPMIMQAGLGCAMENATDKVKEVAKFITKSNLNGGVAEVIHRFFEGE